MFDWLIDISWLFIDAAGPGTATPTPTGEESGSGSGEPTQPPPPVENGIIAWTYLLWYFQTR